MMAFIKNGLVIFLIAVTLTLGINAKPKVKAIQHIGQTNHTIQLEDDAFFEVYAPDIPEIENWRPLDRVHVSKVKNVLKTWTMYNIDRNEQVRVRKINIK